VDSFLVTRLSKTTGKYSVLERYLETFYEFERKRAKEGKTAAFAVGMNLLQLHPAVVEKLTFHQVKDKSEAPSRTDEPLVDCTNTTDYSFIPHKSFDEVNFAPNMNGTIPPLRTMMLGTHGAPRLPQPLMAQWSTAYGAIGHAISGQKEMDADAGYITCVAQCNGTYYFARYHSVARFFLNFIRVPSIIQVVVALLYDITMRTLALTGLTWLFFSSELYSQSMHQTGEQSVAILAARWSWFGENSKYQHNIPFPASFEEMPGVPNCFSFVWMTRSRTKLRVRMSITIFLAVAAVVLVSDSVLQAQVTQLAGFITSMYE